METVRFGGVHLQRKLQKQRAKEDADDSSDSSDSSDSGSEQPTGRKHQVETDIGEDVIDMSPMTVVKISGKFNRKLPRTFKFKRNKIKYIDTESGAVKGTIPAKKIKYVTDRDSDNKVKLVTKPDFHNGGFELVIESKKNYKRFKRIVNHMTNHVGSDQKQAKDPKNDRASKKHRGEATGDSSANIGETRRDKNEQENGDEDTEKSSDREPNDGGHVETHAENQGSSQKDNAGSKVAENKLEFRNQTSYRVSRRQATEEHASKSISRDSNGKYQNGQEDHENTPGNSDGEPDTGNQNQTHLKNQGSWKKNQSEDNAESKAFEKKCRMDGDVAGDSGRSKDVAGYKTAYGDGLGCGRNKEHDGNQDQKNSNIKKPGNVVKNAYQTAV